MRVCRLLTSLHTYLSAPILAATLTPFVSGLTSALIRSDPQMRNLLSKTIHAETKTKLSRPVSIHWGERTQM